ncbi:MAG: hypothetical protein WBA77_02135 [Microcoleaceae cyanobacterium]
MATFISNSTFNFSFNSPDEDSSGETQDTSDGATDSSDDAEDSSDNISGNSPSISLNSSGNFSIDFTGMGSAGNITITNTNLDSDEHQGNSSLILGSAEADILTGTTDDEWIDGYAGDDTLTGGGGSDQFVLASGNGSDIITDFEDGQDILVLDGLTFDQLTIEAASGGTVVLFGEEVLVTLEGIDSDLITGDDFVNLL